MAQRLKAFTSLTKDPTPTWWFIALWSSSTRGSDVLFLVPMAPGIQTYMRANKHTHKIKTKKSKKDLMD